MSEEDEGPRPIDDRFEILEVWRRPLRGDVAAAVRVLAKVEAGAYGPEEYAVGISTRPDAQLAPLLDEADLFTGPVVRRGPLGRRRAGERGRPRRGRREPAVRPARAGRPGLARGGAGVRGDRAGRPALGAARALGARRRVDRRPGRYAIATYTLDCGHQAVELLRQDPDAAPFWVEDGSVDHLVARDARSLTRLLYRAVNLEEAQQDHRGGPGQPRPAPRGRRPRRRGAAATGDRPSASGSSRGPSCCRCSTCRRCACAGAATSTCRRPAPLLLVCNHVSVADPLVLMAAARPRRTLDDDQVRAVQAPPRGGVPAPA